MRQEDKQEIEEAWMQVKRNQINKYQEAIRANRQIAAVLQTRGMNENAIYFAYRAQLLKQWILRQNLLQKHVQRDMSKVLLLLAIFCIIALFIALVWLQSNASQNNFCPPFHNYWWANQPICQHSGGQLFTIWMANLPQWLVLSTLMFLGGIFFLSLLGIPFFQDPQQGNQWQIYPTLGILLIGILLLVAPPLAILPSIILSLFDPHNLSHVLLNLAPFLTTCFCYILWRVVSRNIKRLKQPTGSISPILYILDFVLGFSVLFILIFLIGFIIVIWNYEYTILTIILQVCFPFLLYFIWKGLQYIQRIQNVKKDILSWAIEFLKTLANYGRYTFSLFLDALAGYGYKPWRSIGWYVVVIIAFAFIYSLLGMFYGPHVEWNEALVVSLTAFHGRGFFSDMFKPGDPQAAVAAIEAVIGLIIEISFIATFTQRFFGK